MTLRLDWCSHAAAKYAVEHWHYSRTMPTGKLVKVGAWEHARFIGCTIFGRGSIYRIGDPYNLPQTGVCELVRVALDAHDAPVSQIVAIALRMLHKQSPDVRLIVSYADPDHGHNGAIYQAMNWLYVGATASPWKMVHGEVLHPRSLYSRYGTHALEYIRAHVDPNASIVDGPAKHKYLYPLDAAMRAQIAPLAKPYPKRASSIAADAPAIHAGEGGSTPTDALHELAVA